MEIDRTIAPRYDVRLLVKARTDKRGRTIQAFETIEQAEAERQHRIRLLRKQGSELDHRLGDILDGCSDDDPCSSGACPVCGRNRRIFDSASILAFLADYPLQDLRFVTLINPKDAVPAGQLRALIPSKLINRTRRQLERAGIDKTNSFLIGHIDGEWDEGWGVYQLHIHAITWKISDQNLREVVERWPKHERIRCNIYSKRIDDLARIVLYLKKTYWPSVARAKNPNHIHRHGKRRPPENVEAEMMHCFHNVTNKAWFMYRVKWCRSKIVKS